MDYIDRIRAFVPANRQEAAEQAVMLNYIAQHEDTVLYRDDPVAHITSSGFIMNRQLTKVLLVHHNIRNVWGWTGGHADGDGDLLHVAVKEAGEETGADAISPLSENIASLDILPVFKHDRKGRFVNSHLHLSVSYILICGEQARIAPRPSENSAVAWFDTGYINEQNFDSFDTYLYNKLIAKAKAL